VAPLVPSACCSVCEMDLQQLLQLGQDNAVAVAIAFFAIVVSLVLAAGLGRRRPKVFLDPQARPNARLVVGQRHCYSAPLLRQYAIFRVECTPADSRAACSPTTCNWHCCCSGQIVLPVDVACRAVI
jgi:hypothetical protein